MSDTASEFESLKTGKISCTDFLFSLSQTVNVIRLGSVSDQRGRFISKLDSKATMNKVAKATKLAYKALERYGEPTMTLELGQS